MVGIDYKKAIWYGSAKLDNRLFQKIQYFRRSNKVYWKYQGKLERGTDSRKKKLTWGENPERDLPGRCTNTITVCSNDNASQSHA